MTASPLFGLDQTHPSYEITVVSEGQLRIKNVSTNEERIYSFSFMEGDEEIKNLHVGSVNFIAEKATRCALNIIKNQFVEATFTFNDLEVEDLTAHTNSSGDSIGDKQISGEVEILYKAGGHKEDLPQTVSQERRIFKDVLIRNLDTLGSMPPQSFPSDEPPNIPNYLRSTPNVSSTVPQPPPSEIPIPLFAETSNQQTLETEPFFKPTRSHEETAEPPKVENPTNPPEKILSSLNDQKKPSETPGKIEILDTPTSSAKPPEPESQQNASTTSSTLLLDQKSSSPAAETSTQQPPEAKPLFQPSKPPIVKTTLLQEQIVGSTPQTLTRPVINTPTSSNINFHPQPANDHPSNNYFLSDENRRKPTIRLLIKDVTGAIKKPSQGQQKVNSSEREQMLGASTKTIAAAAAVNHGKQLQIKVNRPPNDNPPLKTSGLPSTTPKPKKTVVDEDSQIRINSYQAAKKKSDITECYRIYLWDLERIYSRLGRIRNLSLDINKCSNDINELIMSLFHFTSYQQDIQNVINKIIKDNNIQPKLSEQDASNENKSKKIEEMTGLEILDIFSQINPQDILEKLAISSKLNTEDACVINAIEHLKQVVLKEWGDKQPTFKPVVTAK